MATRGLSLGVSDQSAPHAEPSDPQMDRAKKEFRIAQIRLEIARLNFEKKQLRLELAKP